MTNFASRGRYWRDSLMVEERRSLQVKPPRAAGVEEEEAALLLLRQLQLSAASGKRCPGLAFRLVTEKCVGPLRGGERGGSGTEGAGERRGRGYLEDSLAWREGSRGTWIARVPCDEMESSVLWNAGTVR
ncbi:unnamed protein product [Lampetra planeri]